MDTYTGNLEVAPETTPTPTPTPPPGYLFYDPNEYRGTATAWRAVTSTTIQEDAYVEIGGDVRQTYEDGYVAYLGYRKNNGGWIEIGRNTSSSYITVHKNDSVNEGDTIDFGLKWGGTGGIALGKNLYIKITPTPPLTPTPTPTPKTTAEFACVQKWETPKPDTLSEIILSSVKNTGGKAGKVYAAAAELDSTGTVIDEFYRGSTDLNAGQCASFRAEQPTRTGYLSPATCGPCPWGGCIYINKPEGTYYYGVKTWGEDEAEPSYPVPDASDQPANAKAWSFVCELPTPTPTPTPPSITGECVFPRIIAGTLTPRLDTGIIFYRVRCIIDKWV